jgi:antitoxin component of MazEF toxin-antitoxin module
MEREIILKMLSAEAKIPADILEVLGIQQNQKLLVTLYSDRAITIEPAPTLKTAKPTIEPIPNVKPAKAKPARAKPIRAKATLPAVPTDHIQIGTNMWLTKKGEVKRLVKGRLEQYMSAEKIMQLTDLIRGVPGRSEAIKTLMEKGNYSKNTATIYYSAATRAITHLQKMGILSGKEKPVPVTESPEEHAKRQENMEQVPATV